MKSLRPPARSFRIYVAKLSWLSPWWGRHTKRGVGACSGSPGAIEVVVLRGNRSSQKRLGARGAHARCRSRATTNMQHRPPTLPTQGAKDSVAPR